MKLSTLNISICFIFGKIKMDISPVVRDCDGKMEGGRLQDPGSVSGHIVGVAIVELLGDHRGGLVDSGHTLGLGLGHMGVNGSGRAVLRAIGGHSVGGRSAVTHSGHGVVGGSTVGASQDKASVATNLMMPDISC